MSCRATLPCVHPLSLKQAGLSNMAECGFAATVARLQRIARVQGGQKGHVVIVEAPQGMAHGMNTGAVTCWTNCPGDYHDQAA